MMEGRKNGRKGEGWRSGVGGGGVVSLEAI